MKNLYLIGLTGNLGSGKSTVRKMLEQLGARGIDADALAHAAMQRGSPTWHAIVETFGMDILQFNGRIDRRKLGARVFADAGALARLEAIVHPAVGALTKEILREVQEPVAVIEAIKLVEAGMHLWCDALWVVTCAPEVQVERVMHERQMRVEEARARLAAQGTLNEKLRLADVVIDNSGDENTTRAQVQRAWNALRLETARDKSAWLLEAPRAVPAVGVKPVTETTKIEVRRARRSDLAALGVALAKREERSEPLSPTEALKRLGARGYRLALAEGRIIALLAWEAENLVAVTREVWAESEGAARRALPPLFELVEQEARELQCEVSLLMNDTRSPAFVAEQARACAYQPRELSALHPIWRQIAAARFQPGDQVWVKRLREDFVTKPV